MLKLAAMECLVDHMTHRKNSTVQFVCTTYNSFLEIDVTGSKSSGNVNGLAMQIHIDITGFKR